MTDRQAARENEKVAFQMLHRSLIEKQTFRSCLNCLHFVEINLKAGRKSETCARYGMTPPARVIVFSCGDGWEDDIPF